MNKYIYPFSQTLQVHITLIILLLVLYFIGLKILLSYSLCHVIPISKLLMVFAGIIVIGYCQLSPNTLFMCVCLVRKTCLIYTKMLTMFISE